MVTGHPDVHRAVVLLQGRGRPLTAQRATLLAAATTHQAKVSEVLPAGRTYRGVDRVRELGGSGAIDCVIVASITTLARSEALQLSTVGELAALGVTVVSTSEPWITDCATTVQRVAQWLLERDRTRRAAQVRTSLSRARASGVRIGRPRREIPPTALQLVKELGIGKAARELGLGESTLRRFVRAASPTPNPGGAQ